MKTKMIGMQIGLRKTKVHFRTIIFFFLFDLRVIFVETSKVLRSLFCRCLYIEEAFAMRKYLRRKTM
jgi:hypothetical protein